jgi:large subunit ribosomal protein L29
MKPRKIKDLRELSNDELNLLLLESEETLAKQRFQHALKQLQDTSYLKIIRSDIARIKTLLNERNKSNEKLSQSDRISTEKLQKPFELKQIDKSVEMK